MFRQKKGISPTALLIGSSLLIAALSPEIRRKITGMVSGQMQHKDGAHSMQPAELIKQAFGGESGRQQHEQTSRNHSGASSSSHEHSRRHTDGQTDRRKETSAKPHYTEPIHFEESAVNVLNDSTVMNMLEEIEPGNQ